MLSKVEDLDTAFFEDLRAQEFARLDRAGLAYLDFAASGLHATSQAIAYAGLLADGILGNPHSEHQPSRDSMAAIDAARNGGPPVPSHHSPLFKIAPEPAIVTGAVAMTAAVLDLLPVGGPVS